MPSPQSFPVIARLRRHLADPPTDAELLGRFITSRDDDAFGELVRRHGPTVLAVCRRVTGNRDDADDAFQAAFLVLARKPDRVQPGSPLGGWLYGVAVRAARKAVARTARRRGWEAAVAELPEVPDRPPASDPEAVRAVLEEVARLSEAYRAAVVLCELEGRSRSAAARELGIAEGTLSSRLAAARRVLARRLRDRGLAPAVLAAVAGSAACPVLAADAARLAGTSASPDPRVEELSEAAMRSAILSKWKLLPVAAMLAAVGLAVSAAEPRVPDEPKPPAVEKQPAPKSAEPKPLPKGPNKLLVWRKDEFVLIDPDGKNERVVIRDTEGITPGKFALSPDGSKVAVFRQSTDDGKGRRAIRYHVFIRELGKDGPGTDIGEAVDFAWSGDGTELAVSQFDTLKELGKIEATHTAYNLATKGRAKLDLPDKHYLTDWSRDGRHFLTTARDGMYVMNRDGTINKQVLAFQTEKWAVARGKFSPDGRRVLFRWVELKPTWQYQRLGVADVTTGEATPLRDVPPNGDVQGYCWSPDGKRIAYAWREVHEGKPEEVRDKETESRLVVCDPDGKNAKTIATEKANGQWTTSIGGVDWR